MAKEGGAHVGKCPACKSEDVTLRDVSGLFICERCSSKRFSANVRKRIQEAFERQEEYKRRQAWMQRIAVAKRGVRLYEASKLSESLRAFRDYISILETGHAVPKDGLAVNLFDGRKDAGEILLIAGVYWDMAQIYDHMKDHQAELRGCLNKYVEFSLNRPHTVLASEALRKYLASGRVVHKEDFRNAHGLLRTNLTRCFVSSAVFGPLSPEVDALRTFRDAFLARSAPGRVAIRAYERASPPLARFLLRVPPAAAAARAVLRPLARTLSLLYKGA